MLRKVLLLSLLVPAMYAATGTNTSASFTQRMRSVKVHMRPTDGAALQQCVNNRIHPDDRVYRHNMIVQGQQGQMVTDSLSVVEAELGNIWHGRWNDNSDVIEAKRVRQLIYLARALDACSRTYEIEVPVDPSIEYVGDNPTEARFIAIPRKDTVTYIIEAKKTE